LKPIPSSRNEARAPFVGALLVVLLASTASGTSVPNDARVAELSGVLVEYLAEPDERHDDALIEIVGLGPAAVPPVWTILTGRAPAPEGLEGPLLRGTTEALLLEALRAWPAPRVVRELTKGVNPESTLDDRLRAIGLVGEVGQADSFLALLELASDISSMDYKKPRVKRAVEGAMAELLERDARAMRVLELRLRSIDPRVLESTAWALGEIRGSDSLRLLERMTGSNKELDVAVLQALASWDSWAPEALDDSCADLAFEFLSASDPDARRHAAIALGNLCCVASTPALLALLHDPDRRVQRSATWSLQRISGLKFSTDPQRWQRWYEREQAWFKENKSIVGRFTGESDAGQVGRLLQQAARHPLFRRELSEGITPLLRNRNQRIVIAAANTLARLEDPAAVRPLVEALGDYRIGVRASALNALFALTGERLPPDARDWLDWLEG
jgi:hypothetical protein